MDLRGESRGKKARRMEKKVEKIVKGFRVKDFKPQGRTS